ncbi:peptide chain release factor N(5)-glutamine methyltransferase [soil metagenome]
MPDPDEVDGAVPDDQVAPEPTGPAPDDLSAAEPPPEETGTARADVGLADGTVPWRALMAEAADALVAAGLLSADVDARRIVEEASGHEGAALHAHLDDPATVNGVAALDRMVERRRNGEPLQYVLGRWGFRTLDLMVDARVLIPRPETEGLVDHVHRELERINGQGGHDQLVVLDLGCGSGAIGLAVAAERRDVELHALDRDPEAVAVTRANLAGLGVAGASVAVHEGSWFAPLPADLAGRVAAVVANPPYVAASDELPTEVGGWEPAGALVSGATGLEAIAEILADAPTWLVPGGAVVIEIGETQGPAARDRAEAAGLSEAEVRTDLLGRDRVLVARSPARPSE